MKKSKDITDRQIELDNCIYVKTILMILVVLYHSVIFWRGGWINEEPIIQAKSLAILAEWLNSFHIYGFVLVSGYLFYFLRYEKESYSLAKYFFNRKIKRLLVPYVFAAVIWVIPISNIFFDYDMITIFNNYFLAIAPKQLWFLVMLFNVFAIFWPISNVMEKYNFIGVIIVVFFYIVGRLCGHFMPNIFQLWTAFRYIPFFLCGFKIRQYGSDTIKKIPALFYILIDIILFILCKVLENTNTNILIIKLFSNVLSVVLNITGAIMAFVVLQKLAGYGNWKNNRKYLFICKCSMPVYLLHQQIIYFSLVLLNGLINPYLHAVINFICAMFVSLLLSAILLKYKPTRFMIGEK